MSEVQKEFILCGFASEDDWELATRLLGRLGLELVPVAETVTQPGPGDTGYESEYFAGPRVPYILGEISSPEQYVGYEHLLEFWKDYRKRDLPSRLKRRDYAVDEAFDAVLEFRTRGDVNHPANLSGDQARRERLRKSAGLAVVRRTEIGFCPPQRKRYVMPYEIYAVQAGGLIEFVRDYDRRPEESKLWELKPAGVAFLTAFTEVLTSQIG